MRKRFAAVLVQCIMLGAAISPWVRLPFTLQLFSKEKARVFYMFPFHSFHYSFQCCVTKFRGYFCSTVSLFCLLLCCPDKQWTYAIGRESIEDGKPCVTSMAIIFFEKDFSQPSPSFKYPASRKIEVTLLAGYPLNRSFWLKTRVWAILSTVAQMWRAKGDVST